jgi:hypothetical protein
MHARKQYLEELRKEYEQAGPLKRDRLLDEAQKRTRMNRKYLIRDIFNGCNRAGRRTGLICTAVFLREVNILAAGVFQVPPAGLSANG